MIAPRAEPVARPAPDNRRRVVDALPERWVQVRNCVHRRPAGVFCRPPEEGPLRKPGNQERKGARARPGPRKIDDRPSGPSPCPRPILDVQAFQGTPRDGAGTDRHWPSRNASSLPAFPRPSSSDPHRKKRRPGEARGDKGTTPQLRTCTRSLPPPPEGVSGLTG